MVRAALPPEHHRLVGISARVVTRVFVMVDVVSFLVQGAGSSVASSDNWAGPTAEKGVNILLGGLGLQVLGFGFFLAVLGVFHRKANRFERADAPAGWRRMLWAVYVCSFLILVSGSTASPLASDRWQI
jgi:hypothetical protein